MPIKKKGLGKGLDSLIPDNKSMKSVTSEKTVESKEDAAAKSGVQVMKINEVEPNRDQPRKNFDEDALLELSDSIKQFGVLQPLLVRKRKDYYEIIAGERRWRAAKLAGVKEVPVIEKEYTDQEILEIGLIENIQRENLNPIEEAIAFQKNSGKRLGTILLENHYINETQLIEVLRIQLGIDFIDLNKTKIDPYMAGAVSKVIAQQYRVVAFRKEKNVILLAMEDPLNFRALETVKQTTKCKVRLYIAYSEAIDRTISVLYENEGEIGRAHV